MKKIICTVANKSDISVQEKFQYSGLPRGGVGVFKPPEIPKAFQNRTKLNPIVKTAKQLLNLGC